MPFYFGWGDRKLNIIHNRLRNMCSSLNADLHLVNLKPSPACICGHGFEDCIHFFFECPFYNEKKVILFNKLENCVVTIELILAGDDNLTIKTLNSSLLFILLLEAPSAFNVLSYSLQSMLLCLFESLLLLNSTVFNILFHLILLYTYFIIIV